MLIAHLNQTLVVSFKKSFHHHNVSRMTSTAAHKPLLEKAAMTGAAVLAFIKKSFKTL